MAVGRRAKKKKKGSAGTSARQTSSSEELLKHIRFVGISLSGAKNDRTALVVLDYYPEQRKLFLRNIYDHLKTQEELSSDQILLEVLTEHSPIEGIAVDVPLELPLCVDCKCRAQNIQDCDQPEVQWMWKEFRKIKRKKPRTKLFTPYTMRAIDMYIADTLEGDFHPPESLGANSAPLAARAAFLKKRIKKKLIEVNPRVSLWRLGKALKVSQAHLKHYKHSVGGDESRQIILQSMVKQDLVFIYQADFLKLADNCDTFDAFISAMTAFLKHRGQTEKPPKDFPKQTGWVEFPVDDPQFF